MEIATAKEYYLMGNLERVLVRAPDLLNAGYTIELGGNIGNANPILQTFRKENRCFKTLDAAAKAVNEIGFNTFEVIIK